MMKKMKVREIPNKTVTTRDDEMKQVLQGVNPCTRVYNQGFLFLFHSHGSSHRFLDDQRDRCH